ncbi:hypothetical protein FRB99_002919, partial [Tulasnella sp. 403]
MGAALTQLIFEHSLRIRMKDDPPASGTSTAASSATTPTHGSLEEDEETSEGEDTIQKRRNASATTGTAANTSTATASPTPSNGTAPEEKDEGTHRANLVGKFNNLVSTDLGNLVDGHNFLPLLIWAPLEILLSTRFLYNILGWSAIVIGELYSTMLVDGLLIWRWIG